MAEERIGFQVWGDDPESDRYGTRSKAFLPTDWTDDLVHKDYIKNKHMNSISEALLRLNSRCDSFRFINYSELVDEVTSEETKYFKAFSLNDSLSFPFSLKVVTIIKFWNETLSFSKQEIVFDNFGRIIDLGSGKFNFGYRVKAGQFDFCLPISQSDDFTWFWSVRSLSDAKVVHCVPGDSLFVNVAGPNYYEIQNTGPGLVGPFFVDHDSSESFIRYPVIQELRGNKFDSIKYESYLEQKRTRFTEDVRFNDGVKNIHVSLDGDSEFRCTFNPLNQPIPTGTSSMSQVLLDIADSGLGKPTLFYGSITPGTSGFPGNSSFNLDVSSPYKVGEIISVKNYGYRENNGDLIRQDNLVVVLDSLGRRLTTILPHCSKRFILEGAIHLDEETSFKANGGEDGTTETVTVPAGDYPIWSPL
jgi:hypothetical protein